MPENAVVDFISSPDGQSILGSGAVAERLLRSNMNVRALRTNAVLRKDEWLLLDQVLIQIARERLIIAQDLISRGLTLNVRNGLGTTVVQHETVSEMTEADVTMDGVTRSQRDRVEFSLVSTPLPIIHKDFQISARVLAASRTTGQPLDTTMAEEATRQVIETIESMVLNGRPSRNTLGFGTSAATLYGYTNRPGRNTVTLATQWDASAASGETILADILSMVTAAHNDRMFGPYVLYIPTGYGVILQDDFKANSDKTIIQRIREIDGIADVKVADKLTAHNVLLVQMTKSNVDMVVGMQPTLVEWPEQGGMVLNYKVMAIMVPRVKLDHGGRSGIVHLAA